MYVCTVCMYATFILRMLLIPTSCTMNSEPPPSNSDTTHDTITIPEVSSTKDAKQGTLPCMHGYIHTYIHPNGSSPIQVYIHTYINTLT